MGGVPSMGVVEEPVTHLSLTFILILSLIFKILHIHMYINYFMTITKCCFILSNQDCDNYEELSTFHLKIEQKVHKTYFMLL